MKERRNKYDVTNRIDVTSPDAVCDEVCALFAAIYPKASSQPIKQAFQTVTTLFRGDFPGYYPCDTPYHDLQHTLDVSLTMARMLYGHETSRSSNARLGMDLTRLGIVISLFHDSGYVRRRADRRHKNGAAYTRKHVTRSGRFLESFLPGIGMEEMVPLARRLVHFTGYEIAVHAIPLRDTDQRTLGKLLGTADLLAQMSDRCYLEKCRDRLYPEFVAAGMAGPEAASGMCRSPEELIYKTPQFFKHVLHDRLDNVLKGVHSYARLFFLPECDYYQDAVQRNYAYLEHIVDQKDVMLLRRKPPWTLTVRPEQVLLLPDKQSDADFSR